MNSKFLSLSVLACVLSIASVSAKQPKKLSIQTIHNGIMEKRGIWKDSSKVAICNLLENIKIAYENKDSDFLEKTFKPVSYITKYKVDEKDRYIAKLKECFRSDEPIEMLIYDYSVAKTVGGETYVIRLYHGYKFKRKKDKGYLFFMVDLNYPQQPEIKIWVWQSKRDPKINSDFGKKSPDYGLFYGGNFN